MKVSKLEVGYLKTNCYFLQMGNDVLVIDPGDDYLKIKEKLGDKKLIGIIITHYHFDHVGALPDLHDDYNIKVYGFQNLVEGINQIGKFNFECIRTPGHKEDLISLYFPKDKMVFCGDFIFENTIGRCDLKGGDFAKMQKSIANILKLNDDVIVYPGHGNWTSIGKERKNLEQYL